MSNKTTADSTNTIPNRPKNKSKYSDRKRNIDVLVREVIGYIALGHTWSDIENFIGVKKTQLLSWAEDSGNLELKIAMDNAEALGNSKVLGALYQAATIGFQVPVEQVEEEFDEIGLLVKRKVIKKKIVKTPDIKAMELWLKANVKAYKPPTTLEVEHKGAIPVVSMIPASQFLANQQQESSDNDNNVIDDESE